MGNTNSRNTTNGNGNTTNKAAFELVREDIVFILGFLFFSLVLGVLGYHFIVGFAWFRSFYNSAFILSGTGTPDDIPEGPGQLFVALYALYGALVFLVIFAVIIGRIATIAANNAGANPL